MSWGRVPNVRKVLSCAPSIMITGISDVVGTIVRQSQLEFDPEIAAVALQVAREYQAKLWDLDAEERADDELEDIDLLSSVKKDNFVSPLGHFHRFGRVGLLCIDALTSNMFATARNVALPLITAGQLQWLTRVIGESEDEENAHRDAAFQHETELAAEEMKERRLKYDDSDLRSFTDVDEKYKEKLLPCMHSLVICCEQPIVWHRHEDAKKFVSDPRRVGNGSAKVIKNSFSYHIEDCGRLLVLLFAWKQKYPGRDVLILCSSAGTGVFNTEITDTRGYGLIEGTIETGDSGNPSDMIASIDARIVSLANADANYPAEEDIYETRSPEDLDGTLREGGAIYKLEDKPGHPKGLYNNVPRWWYNWSKGFPSLMFEDEVYFRARESEEHIEARSYIEKDGVFNATIERAFAEFHLDDAARPVNLRTMNVGKTDVLLRQLNKAVCAVWDKGFEDTPYRYTVSNLKDEFVFHWLMRKCAAQAGDGLKTLQGFVKFVKRMFIEAGVMRMAVLCQHHQEWLDRTRLEREGAARRAEIEKIRKEKTDFEAWLRAEEARLQKLKVDNKLDEYQLKTVEKKQKEKEWAKKEVSARGTKARSERRKDRSDDAPCKGETSSGCSTATLHSEVTMCLAKARRASHVPRKVSTQLCGWLSLTSHTPHHNRRKTTPASPSLNRKRKTRSRARRSVSRRSSSSRLNRRRRRQRRNRTR